MCIDDIYLWADGTWCYSDDFETYITFMSDDFECLRFESDAWVKFVGFCQD